MLKLLTLITIIALVVYLLYDVQHREPPAEPLNSAVQPSGWRTHKAELLAAAYGLSPDDVSQPITIYTARKETK